MHIPLRYTHDDRRCETVSPVCCKFQYCTRSDKRQEDGRNIVDSIVIHHRSRRYDDYNNTCTSPGRGRCSRHSDKEGRWNKHALKTAFARMSLATELFGKRSARDSSLCARECHGMPRHFLSLASIRNLAANRVPACHKRHERCRRINTILVHVSTTFNSNYTFFTPR